MRQFLQAGAYSPPQYEILTIRSIFVSLSTRRWSRAFLRLQDRQTSTIPDFRCPVTSRAPFQNFVFAHHHRTTINPDSQVTIRRPKRPLPSCGPTPVLIALSLKTACCPAWDRSPALTRPPRIMESKTRFAHSVILFQLVLQNKSFFQKLENWDYLSYQRKLK